jgi:hypothetical protein
MNRYVTQRSPCRMEYYFRSDEMQAVRTLAVMHGHKILVEATNPNTAETGIAVEFSDEVAAKLFQETLASKFKVHLNDLDQESRHA